MIVWSKEISEPTKPILTKFSGLVDMWLLMFDLVFVSQSLKGCCHGNQFSKSAEISDMPSFLGLTFHNGLQDGKADGLINTADVPSTSPKNLVSFGPLTPQFTMVIRQPF